MVVRKAKRNRHQRGRRTCGWGFGKRHRGKGSRGGHGHSGAGKRGAHNVSFYTAHGGSITLGKRGMQFKVRTYKQPVKIISIETIDAHMHEWGKKVGDVMELDLTKLGYTKVLSSGKLNHKLKIICQQFSESAKKKIEEAGGQAVQPK